MNRLANRTLLATSGGHGKIAKRSVYRRRGAQSVIDRKEIDAKAAELQVVPAHVQRDYVHGLLLSTLYSSSPLASSLVLKGGNALRKAYFEHSRYSADLDFGVSSSISNAYLSDELTSICETIAARSAVEFDLSRTRVQDKRNIDSDRKVSEARLYFRDFYGEQSEIVISVRMDVTQFDRLYLPVQERILIHPYSDASQHMATIKCAKIEEILATKLRCLLQRNRIADLFDLVYAFVIKSGVDIDISQLIGTFFRITVFGRSPAVAKGLFLDLPLDGADEHWNQHVHCPVPGWFAFETAKNSLMQMIDTLFPVSPERERSPIYFSSVLRAPILQAADSQTLLRLTYHGVTRLVEPYELTFMVRKDGVAREYLFAYDTTGGRSSGPSIKSFVPGDVAHVELTDQPFTPRYEIKTSRAGNAEDVSRFYGNRGFRRLPSFPRFGAFRPRNSPKVNRRKR